MEGDSLYQDRQQLQSLLEQYRDGSTQLPRLKAEDTMAWLEPFMQWSTEWLSTIWEWLESFVGPLPSVPLQIDWEKLFPILFWAAVGVLVIYLVHALVAYCRSLGGRLPKRGTQLAGPITSAAETLNTLLALAVKQERWGLATRLRWRLFLHQMGLQPNTTPHEFFCHTVYPNRRELDHRIPINEQYRIMFTTTDGSRQWFDTYHGELSELEREHRHG